MSDIDIFQMTKQSAERRTRTVDFSEKVPAGATISTGTIAAVRLPDLTSTSATMLASTTGTVSGDTVSFVCLAGTNGVDYRLTVTANLSTADILTADILLRVRDY